EPDHPVQDRLHERVVDDLGAVDLDLAPRLEGEQADEGQVADVVVVIVGQQDVVDRRLRPGRQAAGQAAGVDRDRIVDQEGGRAALRRLDLMPAQDLQVHLPYPRTYTIPQASSPTSAGDILHIDHLGLYVEELEVEAALLDVAEHPVEDGVGVAALVRDAG